MTVTRRAYSYLTIKSVSEDKRIIRGIATTPAVDRVGDIVDPMGVKFNNPMPFLWQHDASKPIGTVKFDKPTKDGITFEAEIPSIAEDGTLKDRIDEAWQSIKLGLVRAVSIGFRAIEYSFMENGGVRFAESECYELSAVTIPAQPEAVMTSIKNMTAEGVAAIKQFDVNAPAATGKIERPASNSPGASGTSTKTVKLLKPKEKPMAKTIAEQISAFEATRAAKAAELETVMTTTEGETLDAESGEAADALTAEIGEVDKHLKRLRLVESLKASTATPVRGVEKAEDGAAVRSGVVVKQKDKLPPGIAATRIWKTKAISRLDGESPRDVARSLYGEDSVAYGYYAKAAVAAATTADDAWAGNLVSAEGGAFADFVEFLRPQTILGKFGADGVPQLRRVPFRRALIGQSSGGNAYWVGEGKPKPLTKFDFTRTTLEPMKVANIAVASEETLRDSSPSAELLIRDGLAAAIAERLDIDFLDPGKALSSGVSPASISNGITPIGSSGNDADAIRTDVMAARAAFRAANNPASSAVWIMSGGMADALSMVLNPLGQPEFSGITPTGGAFFNRPVVVSDYVADFADSGGEYVFLINASDIYLADDGGIRIDMSREASLQMNDAPTTQDATTGTGTSLVSLWQTNTVGFLAERTINWARRRAEAVVVMNDVNWGSPGS